MALYRYDLETTKRRKQHSKHNHPLAHVQVDNLRLLSLEESEVTRFAAHLFLQSVCLIPGVVRRWWQVDCPNALRPIVERFVENEASELIAKREISVVRSASARAESLWDKDVLTVHGNVVSREISATYHKDECAMEVAIRLPLAYPLRSVEVECRKRLGVKEARWRKWVLQIVSLLSNQGGAVLDAILLWKRNVDKEFEGMEPCPICYSILHPSNFALPSRECATCKNKFHSDCLYKWFNTSHKSVCPLCQQPFGSS